MYACDELNACMHVHARNASYMHVCMSIFSVLLSLLFTACEGHQKKISPNQTGSEVHLILSMRFTRDCW